MTTATVEDQQQQQQELQEQQDQTNLNAASTAEDDAQADAEFEAAFNNARGVDDSHAGKTTDKNDADAGQGNDDDAGNGDGGTPGDDDAQAQAAAAAAEEEARKQAEAEAAKNAPVTVTKEQFDNLMAAAAKVQELETKLSQTSDKAFGRIGSLQQTIADLKKSATTGKPLSAVQLKRLSAEFPEMASLLAEDLKESSAESEAPAGNGQAADTLDADAIREQARQETAYEYEQQLIAARHSDWKDVLKSAEFEQWAGGLRPEAQQLLATTSSSQVMGDAIDAFKSFRAKQAEQAATAAAAAQNAHKQRDKRLDAAVTPNGVPASGSVVDEDEAFLAGFKSARGNR